MKTLFVILCLSIFNFTLNASDNYAVTTTNLNLREAETINSNSLKILETGDTVQIITLGEVWSKVQVSELEGYVSSNYIKEINYTPSETSEKKKGFMPSFILAFILLIIITFFIFSVIFDDAVYVKDMRFKSQKRKTVPMTAKAYGKTIKYSLIVSTILSLIYGLMNI